MYINMTDKLIILDWDDTLFPTSWSMINNIYDTDNYKLFVEYDDIISFFLTKLLTYGNVVIVTNATKNWIYISSYIFPKLYKIIKEKIIIMSARDEYKEKYPNNIELWKQEMFKDLLEKYYKSKMIKEIISIGDAEYEFIALLNLAKKDKTRYYKTIRMIQQPSLESLLDQILVLTNSFDNIVCEKKHLDLVFK